MKTHLLKSVALATIMIFTFSSCEVDGDVNNNDNNNPDPGTIEGFKDLNVADTFGWNTAKTVTINFEGIPVDNEIGRPLIIKNHDGEELRKLNIDLSQDISINVNVTTEQETLILSWGSYQKELTLNGNSTQEFTFLEPDTDDE